MRLPIAATLAACLLSSAPLSAQSGPETLVLLVDPTSAESMHFANVYAEAHSIPDALRMYMPPGAANLAAQYGINVEAFLGRMRQSGIDLQVDGVLAMPGSTYFVPASGYISDQCAAVNRFAVTAAYTLANQREDVLAGLNSGADNEFFNANWVGRAFDAQEDYRFGTSSNAPAAERYFLGGLLGWTGMGGNTQQETLDMITRSVAAYGTHPVGTVYYMQTTDIARSGPRHDVYPTAVSRMLNAGGLAEHLFADLPLGKHDVMGVMTGRAALDIVAADMTFLPGSFADHLTSYAGAFWTSSQTKMSRWIAKGASGTAGAVEEPCNYSGKFNRANMHVIYRKGVSLGEAWFRSLGFKPFQNLFMGDPLTRPYALPPTLDVPNAPMGPVSGMVTLTPVAAPTSGATAIARLELLIDGRLVQSIADGGSFLIDTDQLAQGPHALRVLAVDDTPGSHTGRWYGILEVASGALGLSLSLNANAGDQASLFQSTYVLSGGSVEEVVLVSGGRVLASATGAGGILDTYGANLGAGPVQVHLEGRIGGIAVVRSANAAIQVDTASGTPTQASPIAHDSTRRVRTDAACLIDLPASFDVDPATASFQVLAAPTQGTLLTPANASWQVFMPNAGASGGDTLVFQVTTAAGTSSSASVVLLYDDPPCPGFENYCEGAPNSAGPGATLTAIGTTSLAADDFAIQVDGAIPSQFGFMFQGNGRVQNTLSDGFLCIGSNHARYGAQGLDASGSLLFDLDYNAPPLAGAQITVGSTWSFQFWYRDPAAAATGSNLTDAIEAVFCP
ncbi:MAG: hypothetical protein ACI8QC_004426 [Planctomycetota bacterium]|jgi:uncharacterized protein (TIGR03790 family)